MSSGLDISPLTLNRLSVYLRCLRQLAEEGTDRIASKHLAERFHLSAPQIRKDLAHFGELGIRGVGYDVRSLRDRLAALLDLDRDHGVVLVGAGNIGTALVRFPAMRTGSFRIVAALDNDPGKIGREIDGLTIGDSRSLTDIVQATGAEIGILAVPAEAAQENCDALAAAGIRAVLNFAPVQLHPHPGLRIKTVDLSIFLEELAFFLPHPPSG